MDRRRDLRPYGPHPAGHVLADAASSPGAAADLIEQARLMNTLPKYVLTRGTEATDWANSHAIRPEAVIRLIQYPIALSGGTPLFADDGRRRTLTLVDGEDYRSGATVRRYRFLTP